MKEFTDATFGVLHADSYDAEHDPGTTDEAVTCLIALAAGRPTLELAIGTGRVALPMSRAGLSIEGIEASPEMVAKLREKPGGDAIPITLGDMASVRLKERFGFAFLIFNTLFNLRSQQAQVDCFARTAEHLEPGGHFLIETYVPDLSEFQHDQGVRVLKLGFDHVSLEAAEHDPVQQTVAYQRIHIGTEGTRLDPLPIRYAWPAEIDLMAKLAGLELEHRWGDWHQNPFTATSRMHVSVYRKGA